jgi:uncharacterized protein
MIPRFVFGFLTLVIFGGLNVFLYRRMIRDVTGSPWLRRFGVFCLITLTVLVPLVRVFGRDVLPDPWVTGTVLAFWGVTLFAIMVLAAADAVRALRRRFTPEAPIDPKRRQLLSQLTAASAATIGAGLTGFGAYRAFEKPAVTEVPVRLRGLPKALDGFSIVQLSDIHVGPVIQERFLAQLVEVANSAKPDLLAITGDLVDGTPGQLGGFVGQLTRLNARFGRYFVSGNHDYYSGWNLWAPLVEGLGFQVLRNRFVSVGDAGASFDLIGVEDWGLRAAGSDYDLDKATAGRDVERASVLLAHQPNGLDLANAKHIGLQLSGHTHGGQLFPATVLGSLFWGDRNAGLSMHGGTALYTSRGCGFVGPPVRVGAPPEVVKIILLAS